MASDHEWEREWPPHDELLILDGSLDTRTQVDECPKCAAIVRSESRNKHEAACWGPEPLPSGDAGRDLLADYTRALVQVLQSFPELGEHTVKGTAMSPAGARSIHTRFYGEDFWITIERTVQGG